MNEWLTINWWVIPLGMFLMGVIGIGLKTDDNEKKIKELEERMRRKGL